MNIVPDRAEMTFEYRHLAADRGAEEMTDFDRLIFTEYCAGWRELLAPAAAAQDIVQMAGPEAGELMVQIVEDLLYEGEEDIRDWLRSLLL